jgi:transcriptional regulator with AAA-type ATPase domain
MSPVSPPCAPESPAELDYPVVDRSMRPVLETLRISARHNETLLSQGPTGTGKSRLARWGHHASARADHPFVVVTLNTVPTELQASTLFG